jgi:hypothetical protein
MIEIKERNLRQLNRDINKISAGLLTEAGRVKSRFGPIFTHIGNTIRNEIIKSMQSTPRMLRSKKATKKGDRHHPSAPGFPPAIDTGELVKGVIYDVQQESLIVGVVSTGLGRKTRGGFTSYAEILELSKNPRMRRPFLAPAVEKHEDEATDYFLTQMSKHIIKAMR